MDSIDTIRLLVRVLRENHDAVATREVVADWAEEHQFMDIASRLRRPASRSELEHTIWVLVGLFGIETAIHHRYTFIMGLPETFLRPGAEGIVTWAAPLQSIRFRRLVLSGGIISGIAVHDIAVGPTRSEDPTQSEYTIGEPPEWQEPFRVIANGPIPAASFDVGAGFDTFDVAISPTEAVYVRLTSRVPQNVVIGGCILGDVV